MRTKKLKTLMTQLAAVEAECKRARDRSGARSAAAAVLAAQGVIDAQAVLREALTAAGLDYAGHPLMADAEIESESESEEPESETEGEEPESEGEEASGPPVLRLA